MNTLLFLYKKLDDWCWEHRLLLILVLIIEAEILALLIWFTNQIHVK